MRLTLLWALVAVASVAWAPLVGAQAVTGLEITDVDALDEDEDPLRLLPQQGLVIFRVTVNNTGNASANGTFSFKFLVEAEDGTNHTATVRKNLNIAAGNSTTIDYRWTAGNRVLGNHTVTLEIEEVADSAVRTTFTVAKTAVPSGGVLGRMLDFAWFFASFIFVAVLFVVVLAARKR